MQIIMVILILWIITLFVIAISQCAMFSKMDIAWWKSLVPIYRQYLILQAVGLPKWWCIVNTLPILHFSYTITWSAIATYRLMLCFGCTRKLALLFVLLPYIGIPIKSFDSAEYEELEWS